MKHAWTLYLATGSFRRDAKAYPSNQWAKYDTYSAVYVTYVEQAVCTSFEEAWIVGNFDHSASGINLLGSMIIWIMSSS